jgi:hypothetical protein
MILTPAVGQAAGAGPELGILHGIGLPVIALDAGDNTVFDIDPQQATSSAVVGGAAGADHAFFGGGSLKWRRGVRRAWSGGGATFSL